MIVLRQLGSNQTLLRFVKNNGPMVEVLFSYERPVAGWSSNRGYMRSAKQYSATTARHIVAWLRSHNAVAETVSQETIDALLG
jgi:hypothetical protein